MEYKSLQKLTITGKGTVFIVENEKDRNRADNDFTIGDEITIDGDKYILSGVESYAIDIIRKGQKIGLLVKNCKNEII